MDDWNEQFELCIYSIQLLHKLKVLNTVHNNQIDINIENFSDCYPANHLNCTAIVAITFYQDVLHFGEEIFKDVLKLLFIPNYHSSISRS